LGLEIGTRGKGNLGAYVGCPIVTNGEFVAWQSLPKSLWDFLFTEVAIIR